MNRIHPGSAPVNLSGTSSTKLRPTRLPAALRGDAPHALFTPLHYEQNYAYPLLIWLHGPGDDERQLQRVVPLISMRNYVAVGPRGTSRHQDQQSGYHWRQSEADIQLAQQRVLDCLRVASAKLHVAPEKVFIGGYDCGGTMAFRIALKLPQLFAGVLSVAGPFPTTLTPLVNLRRSRGLPLFIAQGRKAQKYTPQKTCDELRLFHSAGLAVTIRQYPCGDELTTQMLHDMDVWMMERATGSAMTQS